jgi:predicted PurR-regulated permease PerM
MIVEIVVLGLLVLIEGYVIWNLIRKTELLETWIENFSDRITRVQQELSDIDSTGHFESDDEIGSIFDSIKEVVNELNNFTEGEEISE